MHFFTGCLRNRLMDISSPQSSPFLPFRAQHWTTFTALTTTKRAKILTSTRCHKRWQGNWHQDLSHSLLNWVVPSDICFARAIWSNKKTSRPMVYLLSSPTMFLFFLFSAAPVFSLSSSCGCLRQFFQWLFLPPEVPAISFSLAKHASELSHFLKKGAGFGLGSHGLGPAGRKREKTAEDNCIKLVFLFCMRVCIIFSLSLSLTHSHFPFLPGSLPHLSLFLFSKGLDNRVKIKLSDYRVFSSQFCFAPLLPTSSVLRTDLLFSFGIFFFPPRFFFFSFLVVIFFLCRFFFFAIPQIFSLYAHARF